MRPSIPAWSIKKYEYIYALFKKNTMSPQPYWYLLDFVVAGEQSGKTLARLFYRCRSAPTILKISSGTWCTTHRLNCSAITRTSIVERIGRFPLRFLQENCPPNMLDIDGIKLEEVYPKHAKDSERKRYFEQLGERIRNTPMVLNNLKNRLEAAIHLTLKRVEWNYKTAIPVYFPTRNLCSLLLPLCLSEEGQVDLALVVEPLQSGAYQGRRCCRWILPTITAVFSRGRTATGCVRTAFSRTEAMMRRNKTDRR